MGNNGISDRLYFWGSKITADGDCSHEIKRCLLLGRKVMTNLESMLKSRGITLLTKVHLGEGNGNPLQSSCLENPGDGGAWWAAVYGITQSLTGLKGLSSSSKKTKHCIQMGAVGNASLFSSVQFSRSVVSDSLRPHELQHARPLCPSPSPGVHSDSCPSSQ